MTELPQDVAGALARFSDAGIVAYAVGGCVRDRLLGRPVHDYDIAAGCAPEKTAEIFADLRVIPTGLKHGTVTVLTDARALEITAFRKEGAYLDGRHPSAVSFDATIEEDLARRDFTMNAIALSQDGTLVDPFGGEADIRRGIIRAVGDARVRFEEDALRILRALRFAAVLGFTIEEETASALEEKAPLLARISRERIGEETVRLLSGEHAEAVLCRYGRVLAAAIPELSPMLGFDQRSPHHRFDVWTHTAKAVAAVPRADSALRLAALLHDVGKVSVQTIDETGRAHYKGHAARSAELAQGILRALRMDNKTADDVLFFVRNHDDPAEGVRTDGELRRLLASFGEERFFRLIALVLADNRAKGTDNGRAARYEQLADRARAILAEKPCLSLRDLAVRGEDIAATGAEGRGIGAILHALLELVLLGELENDRDALLRKARELVEQGKE